MSAGELKMPMVSRRVLPKAESLKFVLKGCLLALLLVYGLFSPIVLKPAYYAFLFWSRGYDAKSYDTQAFQGAIGCRPTDVFFDTVGGRLHGWYFKNPKSKDTVLLVHGQGGNVTMFGLQAALLYRMGCSVFVFDYKGMGRSTGTASLQGLYEDSNAAWKYLVKDAGIDPATIIVFGQSLGTAIATRLATEQKVKALMLTAPYVSLQAASARKFPHLSLYPSWMYPEPDLGCLPDAKSVTVPVLITHGTADGTIPFSEGKAIFDAIPARKVLLQINDCGHSHQSDAVWQKTLAEYSAFIHSLDDDSLPLKGECHQI
jgi:pimeloyl-ACP methyl ester carboxylesterase